MSLGEETFVSALNKNPHSFLQPSLPLYTNSLAYLKNSLDSLAKDVSAVQQERQQEARRKRKRSEYASDSDVLRLKQIHTDGFAVDQIWEQAKRVIAAAADETVLGLQRAENIENLQGGGNAHATANGFDAHTEDETSSDEEVDEDNGEADMDEEGDEEMDFDGEDDFDEMVEDDLELDEDEVEDKAFVEEFVADKFGLNDGFFSIDNFNRQSEFLEQQDARGSDDGVASDEEDVDWNVDPLGQSAALPDATDDLSDEEDNEDGPTFGDPDAPSEDDGEGSEMDDLQGLGGLSNTNDVMYADFFMPPAQKKTKKKGRRDPRDLPKTTKNELQEPNMERTMAAVHRDLFEDDESESEGEEDAAKFPPGDPRSRKSAHERRKAAITEEIRKLEAANVAKRDWTLSGEARAADRPLNSLLEEDLDFERTGKPVPVITAEISESIEDLIKRRILDHSFEDIIRRRPDDLATGRDARRGRLDFELDDQKSKKGLAEEYEEEHLRRTDPNFVDVKDEKLKKEEQEIEALWKTICHDLDNLSSWHFRPKQPAPQLDIRVDAPTITMEDARPSAGGDVAGASQLAPQEVYKGGDAAKGVRDEVVGKGGLPAGKEEMGRDERRRRRRREKERTKKAGGTSDQNVRSKRETKNSEMLGDLKKGGVKVLSNKGQLQDVEGKEIRRSGVGLQNGAGQYKL